MCDLRLHAEYAVSQHGEVWSIADALDRICSVRKADIEVRGDCGREVAPGGESPNTDTVGADGEFRCTRADVAHGALAIKDRCGIVISRSDAVMEHKGSDSAIVEPASDLSTLVVQREMLVAAAGYDDNRGSSRRAGRKIDVKRGLVRVG